MSRQLSGEPILVVDDEQEIRESVRTTLLLGGIRNVLECADGLQAQEMIRDRAIAAVVLDLSMPGMSGEELLALILEEQPGTPVVVATGTGGL